MVDYPVKAHLRLLSSKRYLAVKESTQTPTRGCLSALGENPAQPFPLGRIFPRSNVGKLLRVVFEEGFICQRINVIDLVQFSLRQC